MKYHVRLELARGNAQYWWNWSKDKMIADLLVPFVNGQIVAAKRGGQKRLLNMKNVVLVTIYKTRDRLQGKESGHIPDELKDAAFQKKHACTTELLDEIKVARASVASRSLIQRALAPPEPVVFVVMKFGDEQLDSAYEGVMRPVAREFDLDTLRVDERQDSGLITDQVLDNIASSKYVLADLTGERPNCYYECGYAQALGKELILTIKTEDRIHFDLAGYRFIKWSTESELRRELRKRFQSLTESAER